jgi:GDP-mannose 6-dehydrogenase
MKVSVFGLGYVGCVSAACLAQDGHDVIGIDINEKKVGQIAQGSSPIVEPDLPPLLQAVVRDGRLRVTLDTAEAICNSEISLICVGTPSNHNGSLNLDYVERVCKEIGTVLAKKQEYHVVVVRSTVLPGTVLGRMVPILEANSGRKAGADFGVCMNPEFLREGSAIKDYYNPSYVVIGELDKRSGDAVQCMYSTIGSPVVRTDLSSAEMVKYVSNAYHALKIVFANEIGNLCKAHHIDGQKIMDIFALDRQLNISAAYLKPGFAFGGSCLPKDVRALAYRAKERDIDIPLLNSILPSNRRQIEHAIEMVERTGKKKVGLLGLSFKAGTDDVRESPMVAVVETLLGRGFDIRIYDENLDIPKLVGANKTFLEQELPHIASLMCRSLDDLMEQSEVVVIANSSQIFTQVPQMLKNGQKIIDLVGIAKDSGLQDGNYDGICW